MAKILDACCGSRMFWFDKENPNVTFMDKRKGEYNIGSYATKSGIKDRTLVVDPDVIGDFSNMPFENESFYMVVFDPPHLIRAGDNSWLVKKYGKLDKSTWPQLLKSGFDECMRVLKPNGTLVFKWNEEQIPLKEVLKCFDKQPLFGDKRSKTHWLVFMK